MNLTDCWAIDNVLMWFPDIAPTLSYHFLCFSLWRAPRPPPPTYPSLDPTCRRSAARKVRLCPRPSLPASPPAWEGWRGWCRPAWPPPCPTAASSCRTLPAWRSTYPGPTRASPCPASPPPSPALPLACPACPTPAVSSPPTPPYPWKTFTVHW